MAIFLGRSLEDKFEIVGKVPNLYAYISDKINKQADDQSANATQRLPSQEQEKKW
jgi:hypothetical protein